MTVSSFQSVYGNFWFHLLSSGIHHMTTLDKDTFLIIIWSNFFFPSMIRLGRGGGGGGGSNYGNTSLLFKKKRGGKWLLCAICL